MHEYSRPLGDAIKRARGKLGLTQSEVADKSDIDVRTVLNIENFYTSKNGIAPRYTSGFCPCSKNS